MVRYSICFQHQQIYHLQYSSFSLQAFLMVILFSLFFIPFGPKTVNATNFDVTSYGAIGDGNKDDTEAFDRAWGVACRDTSRHPRLIVPPSKTFLIHCIEFIGPCVSSSIHIELLGNITAPKSLDGWKGYDTNGYLMQFTSVKGLIMDGPGQIDGQGSIWWPKEANIKPTGPKCDCPSMLRFEKCDGLQLRGTRHINSPKSHVSLNGCKGADIGHLYISAPEHAPNTDGISISWSSHVNIHDSVIQSGDDCVAISVGTHDINVTGITCGPGHGISIGSLGKNGVYTTVEQVHVRNCNFSGTQNGARIKTVPYGKGYARSIIFEDIHFVNSGNPIIIDQHYCTYSNNKNCTAPMLSSIQVSDVTYRNIHGSSTSKQAITRNCVGKFNCTGIEMIEVRLTGEDVFAYCHNVQGYFTHTTPKIHCN
ncbi:putative polygalacturonase At3g15720 [Bidens hawaiensis]|uniref:putative polygalacturonase At3g15720 n=1 Tax=Bidens hawaiensis TaxID=980011 RepID=UPI00404A2BC3